jgi:hypothetical protein
MTIEQIDALLSIVATLIPLGVAGAAAFLGLQNRRRKNTPPPSIMIVAYQEAEATPAQRRQALRQRWTMAVFYTLTALGLVLFIVQRLVVYAPTPDTPRNLTVLTLLFMWGLLALYSAILWVCCRTLWTLWRSVRHPARADHTLIVQADKIMLAQRAQTALRRLNAKFHKIDLEAGVVHAHKYYPYNLNNEFFDEISISISPQGEQRCELRVSSYGAMPTFRSDTARNREQVEQVVQMMLK